MFSSGVLEADPSREVPVLLTGEGALVPNRIKVNTMLRIGELRNRRARSGEGRYWAFAVVYFVGWGVSL